MKRLEAGSAVRIRREGSDGEWCPAAVLIASSGNPSTVLLHLNGALRTGGYGGGLVLGAAPLTIDYDAETIINNRTNGQWIETGRMEVTLGRSLKEMILASAARVWWFIVWGRGQETLRAIDHFDRRTLRLAERAAVLREEENRLREWAEQDAKNKAADATKLVIQ